MAGITPNMGIGGFAALAKSYGETAAQTIIQTGEVIQKGLQRMQTNRQLTAMGAELSNLNPQSPDWSQQAVALGARYPLAMQSEAGQFLLGTQAKAHQEWANTQQALQREDRMFNRQVGLENLRTQNDLMLEGVRGRNRASGEVDLSNFNPNSMRGSNPASGVDFFAPSNETLPQSDSEATGGGGALYGMNEPDLVASALGPLRDAQMATGIRPTRSQVFSALSSERNRAQQMKMQEDRQRQSEEVAAARARESEERMDKRFTKTEEARAKAEAAMEERTVKRMEFSRLQTLLDDTVREVATNRSNLDKFLADMEKKKASGGAITQEDMNLSQELHARWGDSVNARKKLESEMKALTEGGSSTPAGKRKFRWDAARGEMVPAE